MVLECGGNGRSFFNPQARGNQWTNGGVGLRRVDRRAAHRRAQGGRRQAVGGVHRQLRRRPQPGRHASKDAISRGVPIKKALDVNNLIVFGDERPAAAEHSRRPGAADDSRAGPARCRRNGSPASGCATSSTTVRAWARTSYRVAIKPMIPGDKPDEGKNFRDLESMPVRSIITSPANGTTFGKDVREVKLRGAAWAGDLTVRRSTSRPTSARPGQQAQLAAPKNPYDWQRWTATVKLPSEGYYEIWTRATDSQGTMQPHIAGNWNPQGYGGNPMHRIAIRSHDACAHIIRHRRLQPCAGRCSSRAPAARAGAGLRAARREAGGLSRPGRAATTPSTPARRATASRSSRSRARRAGSGTRRSTG